MSALQMAEAWGMHPEDVMTKPGGLKWAARYVVYHEQLAKAKKNAE